jgi:hypothetical protein
LKIIALPDLHETGVNYLPNIAAALAEADLVLLVGDMTNGGNNIAHVVNAVQQHNPKILAVPGNWDNDDAFEYLSLLNINLHERHQILNGIAFLGAGGSAAPGVGMRVYTEAEYTQILTAAADNIDAAIPKILVTHQPPTGVLRIRALGSQAIRAFIEETQPLICFTGHVHEARGIERIGSTQVINPGAFKHGYYAYAEIVDGQVAALEARQI